MPGYYKTQRSIQDLDIQDEAILARTDEASMKFKRMTAMYSMIANVLLIPIWSAFLIVFIKWYGGDLMNIAYFALTPIDSLLDGVFNRSFISQINGVMINTHRKIFKYRSMVAALIKIALMMNLIMIIIQSVMITIVVGKMQQSVYYGDSTIYTKSFIGQVVVGVWFLFDLLMNVLQVYNGTFVLEFACLIANDVQFKNLDERGYQLQAGDNHMHCKYLLNKLDLELIKLEPQVVYNEGAFNRFLESNWNQRELDVVEEESVQSPSPTRPRRNSDPSPGRQQGYYEKLIDGDGDLKFDVKGFNP